MKRNVFSIIAAAAAAMIPAAAGVIDFETSEGYTALGIYDCWEESPFRSGRLAGNVGVTSNIDTEFNDMLEAVPNPSEKVAAGQRSRYGSNLFGLRVDLAETFDLNPTAKYVHVMIHKPVEGRVMLVGLGSRRDNPDQDLYVEQFWEVSSNTVEPNQWTDAVFQVRGAGGIDVRSLVVVPHCESPHALTEDFLFYVDNIEINDNPTSQTVYEYYATSFDKVTGKLSRSDRYSTSVSLKGSVNGDQTLPISQQADKMGYHDLTTVAPFNARAGETLTPQIGYCATGWMHTYCYIDFNNDGHFDYEGSASEMVSYSYLNGKNIKGESKHEGSALEAPSFTLPADLAEGLYRMRLKLDWNCGDPAGNTDASNLILSNGGVIVDVMLNIHGTEATVNDFQLNGEVLAGDGSKLSAYKTDALRPMSIIMNPEKGFVNNGFTLKYGYNLDGDQVDKFGNPNWFLQDFPLDLFSKDSNELSIPGKYVWGNMLIEGRMAEEGTVSYYPLNFSKDLTIERADRHLDQLTFVAGEEGQPLVISLADNANPRYVYTDKTESVLTVNPGDKVTVAVNYTGRAMHHYLFVDLNDNGFFTNDLNADGTPASEGELLSYTHFNGKNSKGEDISAPGNVAVTSTPDFTIPADQPAGTYRARFKTDWSNIDPAGQWAENGTNKINDNGGAVCDFTIKVEVKEPVGPVDPVDPGEDSINSVNADSKANETYDLLGRKVVKPTRGGILIVNGQTKKL